MYIEKFDLFGKLSVTCLQMAFWAATISVNIKYSDNFLLTTSAPTADLVFILTSHFNISLLVESYRISIRKINPLI